MRRLTKKAGVLALAAVFFTPAVYGAGSHRADKSVGKKLSQSTSSAKQAQSNRRVRVINASLSVPGKRKSGFHRVAYAAALSGVPPMITAGDLAGLSLTRDPLDLNSNAALVLDHTTNEVLFEKNAEISLPIASITKLMTSLVVVEASQDLDEVLTVTEDDVDREKFSHSRLRVGSQLSRSNMLHIALMSSENRAAAALGRSYPGGISAFVAAMNAKAMELGMVGSRFSDSTGLSSSNVSSARDLAKLVMAAYQHPLIRQYSTDSRYAVDPGGRMLQYRNSNGLIENPDWEIGLQKTGYISEAGRCLVMQVHVSGRPVVMIFLDSKSKQSRLADAGRIRKWLENRGASAMSLRAASRS
ncbi:MAG: D-alanyl-D-alanine endopeptidase [Oxalobacteraceae bacterium]|jgi:D-alanyl-D-alanine endopeptidase (penicillin-binding protein 7)|nr:D-alanyl-D-alanine endopeptidase [Oxalobacteraceae bacterium]